jgi:capsular polysaccharide biosynthesis protein
MKHTSPEILRHLVRRFGLLVLLTVLGATAGGGYGAVKKPSYTAQAYVVVTGQPGEPNTAVNFAQAYGRIVSTGPVADKAAAALGSSRDLKQVTSSTSPDTPVIEITATGGDAKRTAAVANAVAQALVDVGNARKDQTRVTVAILAPASVPASPTSPKPPLELAVGAAAGLLVGGLAVLAGVGRPRAPTSPAAAGPAVAQAGIAPPDEGRRVPLPPVMARPIYDYETRAITMYPEPSYTHHNGEKVVGRAVVFRRDPR